MEKVRVKRPRRLQRGTPVLRDLAAERGTTPQALMAEILTPGRTNREIASSLGVSESTVSRWIRRYVDVVWI